MSNIGMEVASLRFDTGKFLGNLKSYLIEAMDDAVDKCIEISQDELTRNRKSKTGKSKWWDMMRNDVKELNRSVANELIEASVGLPYDDVAKQIIAMLTEEGHAGEIWTKPGQPVFDSEMVPTRSRAVAAYRIPHFEQTGVHWMENVRKMLGPTGGNLYISIIRNAMEHLPESVFEGCIKVSWG